MNNQSPSRCLFRWSAFPRDPPRVPAHRSRSEAVGGHNVPRLFASQPLLCMPFVSGRPAAASPTASPIQPAPLWAAGGPQNSPQGFASPRAFPTRTLRVWVRCGRGNTSVPELDLALLPRETLCVPRRGSSRGSLHDVGRPRPARSSICSIWARRPVLKARSWTMLHFSGSEEQRSPPPRDAVLGSRFSESQ